MTTIEVLSPADYLLELPNIVGWLNSNDDAGGRLFYKRRQIIKAWREAGAYRARTAALPRLERAHIVAEVCFRDRRRRDPNNFYPTAKAAVDGLVDAGVLDDDSTRYLVGPDMREGPVARSNEHLGLLRLHIYRLPAVTP